MIEVRYRNGVWLPAQQLWLDAHENRPFAFVSHAHSDHLARHDEVILSPGTAALMRERMPGVRREHVLPWGEMREFRGFRACLLPAGHIFGSAQIWLESGAGTLLYTGDFKLQRSLSAEQAESRPAETLIMETTFGLPKYRFPDRHEVLASMVAWCRDALHDGAVPVLLGYSLGKSQEILCALIQAGMTPMLHDAGWKMTGVYRALRADFPEQYERYTAGRIAGKVLICPPGVHRTSMVRKIPNRRVAMLTGWALDPGAIFRYQCDAAFPLSDHADYDELLRYVELVQPQRVLTLHGFAAEFARDLRARGWQAWALTEENQLELSISAVSPPDFRVSAVATDSSSIASEFHAFAVIGERISATSSKLRKVELLAGLLRSLSAEALPIATVYCTGRAFPQSDLRTLQVGSAVLRRALLAASGLSEGRLRTLWRNYGDSAKTTHEALLGRTRPEPWSLVESLAFFERLQAARGPMARTELLQARLLALTPIEASYVVRILTGDLRIGLKEGLVEEAIAAAFSVTPEDVREASMLLGDLGQTAVLAARRQLAEAHPRLFHPIKCMLASPEPTASAIWARIGNDAAWIEDKYDGIRAQLHVGAGRVEIFTRDLRCVTGQFADLAHVARAFPLEAIFDGEIVTHTTERKLAFFDLQRRLGRKTEDDLFLGASDVPVVFKAFDLLSLDGRMLLKCPLRERRALLDGLALPAGLERVPMVAADSVEEIETAFQAARERGNEGLIVKDAASLYTPGRRGQAWLKLKRELATLDVVVVGVELGHGRRSHVLSDYTFAVREDATGALLTIGQAYSGLTDPEIEELTGHFTAITLAQRGRYREVRPEIILEIAFDSIQPSDRHASGLALRFPRIKSIRRDKTPAEIDTLSYARSLVGTG